MRTSSVIRQRSSKIPILDLVVWCLTIRSRAIVPLGWCYLLVLSWAAGEEWKTRTVTGTIGHIKPGTYIVNVRKLLILLLGALHTLEVVLQLLWLHTEHMLVRRVVGAGGIRLLKMWIAGIETTTTVHHDSTSLLPLVSNVSDWWILIIFIIEYHHDLFVLVRRVLVVGKELLATGGHLLDCFQFQLVAIVEPLLPGLADVWVDFIEVRVLEIVTFAG